MGYEMHDVGITLDAQGIANGLLELMRRESDDNETLIRFGLLPAGWMESLRRSLTLVIRERLQVVGDEDERTILINPGRESRLVHYKLSRVVAEAMHEVALALYASVDMVV